MGGGGHMGNQFNSKSIIVQIRTENNPDSGNNITTIRKKTLMYHPIFSLIA